MNFLLLQWVGAKDKFIVIAQQEKNASPIENLLISLAVVVSEEKQQDVFIFKVLSVWIFVLFASFISEI